jgi:hypothetical protein
MVYMLHCVFRDAIVTNPIWFSKALVCTLRLDGSVTHHSHYLLTATSGQIRTGGLLWLAVAPATPVACELLRLPQPWAQSIARSRGPVP